MNNGPTRKAINGAYEFCDEQQRLLDEGLISEAEWFENNRRYFTGVYLAKDNPRAQSGHGGDEARYRYTQEMILPAIHRDGTFIDIGCANGHLMEMLDRWLAGSDRKIDFYGLDISPELLDLARRRLPLWADRFFQGNALDWSPVQRFDFVCVRELDYVPHARRREFLDRLFWEYAAEDGRLILGPNTEERGRPGLEEELACWGYFPDGHAAKPHQERSELCRRIFWFDRAAKIRGLRSSLVGDAGNE